MKVEEQKMANTGATIERTDNPPSPAKTNGVGKVENPPEPRKARASLTKVFILFAAGIVILAALTVWGIGRWRFGLNHVSTDDAYVTGDLVNVSPTINGRLSELLVDEGAHVHKGQLLARLTDNVQQADIRAAQAALDTARSQVPQAFSSLQFTEESTKASIRKAQAAIGAQQAKTSGAEGQVTWTTETYANQVLQAESQQAAAEAQEAQSQSQAAAALAGVRTLQDGITTAERARDEAAARVDAARADADRTAKDVQRYQALVDQEAVSRQQFDSIQAQATAARASLNAAQQEAARTVSQVNQAKEAVIQADAQYKAAQKAVAASHKLVQVAHAAVGLAKANRMQIAISKTNVTNNAQQTGQAKADLATAQAGNQQIALKKEQIGAAEAQARQAVAALQNAKIAEEHTFIYAPADGTIVKKVANPGSALSPGQTILTMTSGDSVWVDANLKETQLTDVRQGQPAEVEVDAFPGRVFNGRVESISRATGASTSLLPPDNASGNFTKVVQRITVRIRLIPAEPKDGKRFAQAADINNLRQGMSVVATIDTARR